MTTKTLPTLEELRQEVAAAREHLRLTRVAVAAGDANAEQLAEAERGLRFAEVRIEGIEDARNERWRQADRKRAGEIVEELAELDPLIAKQSELEEQMRVLAAEYHRNAQELRGEIVDAYAELEGIRGRANRVGNRGMLREMGVTVTSATTGIRVGSKRYDLRSLGAVLKDVTYEAGTRAGVRAAGDRKAA